MCGYICLLVCKAWKKSAHANICYFCLCPYQAFAFSFAFGMRRPTATPPCSHPHRHKYIPYRLAVHATIVCVYVMLGESVVAALLLFAPALLCCVAHLLGAVWCGGRVWCAPWPLSIHANSHNSCYTNAVTRCQLCVCVCVWWHLAHSVNCYTLI